MVVTHLPERRAEKLKEQIEERIPEMGLNEIERRGAEVTYRNDLDGLMRHDADRGIEVNVTEFRIEGVADIYFDEIARMLFPAEYINDVGIYPAENAVTFTVVKEIHSKNRGVFL